LNFQLIIRCFSKRFVGPDFDDRPEMASQLKLSEMKIIPTGSVKQELKLLCRIAERVFSRGDVPIEPVAIANLATLLLGMLRTYTTSRKVRVEEEWVLDILRIYRSLLWRMEDVTPHVAFISRLFGPAGHSLSLFNLATVRSELSIVYSQLASHPSSLAAPSLPLNTLVISALIAMDKKLIDSRDFAQCMPVFQALSGEINPHLSSVSTPLVPVADSAPANTTLKRARKVAPLSESSKVRKTVNIISPVANDISGEVQLDVNTLTWSSLLGPAGARFIPIFICLSVLSLLFSFSVLVF
jgi:hypothetical protein